MEIEEADYFLAAIVRSSRVFNILEMIIRKFRVNLVFLGSDGVDNGLRFIFFLTLYDLAYSQVLMYCRRGWWLRSPLSSAKGRGLAWRGWAMSQAQRERERKK